MSGSREIRSRGAGRTNPITEHTRSAPSHGGAGHPTRLTLATAVLLTSSLPLAGCSDRPETGSPGEVLADQDGGWLRVNDPDLEDVREFTAVTEVDGRLVAVGEGISGGMPILTSTDGIDWEPADTPGDAWLGDVIRGGPGAIAVGKTLSQEGALWTSPDGLAWTPVNDPDGAIAGSDASIPDAPDAVINDVTVGGPGFIAVGGRGGAPAVWTSTDGLRWTPADALDGAFDEGVWIGSITVGGPGFVAVGAVAGGNVWTSVDGTEWSRVPHDPAVFRGESYGSMSIVFAGGPGLVAVGGESAAADESLGERFRTVLWTSVDGQTWTRLPEEQHGLDGYARRVVDTGSEFIAVGSRRGDAAIWTSVEGLTWDSITDESFGGPKEEHIGDVIVTSTGMVSVGTTDISDLDDGVAAVWLTKQP